MNRMKSKACETSKAVTRARNRVSSNQFTVNCYNYHFHETTINEEKRNHTNKKKGCMAPERKTIYAAQESMI